MTKKIVCNFSCVELWSLHINKGTTVQPGNKAARKTHFIQGVGTGQWSGRSSTAVTFMQLLNSIISYPYKQHLYIHHPLHPFMHTATSCCLLHYASSVTYWLLVLLKASTFLVDAQGFYNTAIKTIVFQFTETNWFKIEVRVFQDELNKLAELYLFSGKIK